MPGIEQIPVKQNLEFVWTVHHFVAMSEEEIENAFRELRNELKTYKEQVVCLKEDRQILLKHPPLRAMTLLIWRINSAIEAFDHSDVPKCRAFLEKYHIRL